MDIADLDVGDLVELHPASDLWARGARYGVIVAIGQMLVCVSTRPDNRKHIIPPRHIYAIVEKGGPSGARHPFEKGA